MATRLIAGSIELAVSMVDAKNTLRIEQDDTSLDSTIEIWIRAITRECEHQLGRALINQQWRASLSSISGVIVLVNPPLVSVDSFKFYDSDNSLQTLDPADYQVDLVSEPGILTPAVGRSWPALYARADAVAIDYTVGYGATSTDVPAAAKQYILAKLSVQFDPATGGATVGKPFNVAYLDRLLDSLRMYC